MNPATGTIAPDARGQVRLTCLQLGRILAEAGASFDDVAKLTFYVKTTELRPFINEFWLEHFPDPAARPARHTLVYDQLPGPSWFSARPWLWFPMMSETALQASCRAVAQRLAAFTPASSPTCLTSWG